MAAANKSSEYKSFNEVSWAEILLGHDSVMQKNELGI